MANKMEIALKVLTNYYAEELARLKKENAEAAKSEEQAQ